MPRYSKWIRISVWSANPEEILHIRDQVLKHSSPECVKFVANKYKYSIFTRRDLGKEKEEQEKEAAKLKKLAQKVLGDC